MNDTIFGEVVKDGAFDDLTQLFMEASRNFRSEIESLQLSGKLEDAERQLTAQLQKRENIHFMCHVTAVGPDCRELEVGDTAILPPYGGTMITIYDEDGQPKRVFAISERVVLAKWRDE